MLSRRAQQRSDVPTITPCEARSKQGLGVLEALFLSIGFTTSNLLLFVTPIAQGGLGLAVTSLAAAIGTVAALGLATLLITVLISYSLLRVLKPHEDEIKSLLKKQDEVEEKQYELFGRLLYFWHLLSKVEGTQDLKQKMQRKIQIWFNVDVDAAYLLADKVEKVYAVAEREVISRISENPRISGEKAIKQHLLLNQERFAADIDEAFAKFYAPPPPSKNWQPEIIGLFAGFISFMNMSAGFLGTYSSLLALASAVTTVSLAIPILGWAFFAASLLVALGVGLAVRHFTQKNIIRQRAISNAQAESDKLTEVLVKIHDPEIAMLNRQMLLEEKRVARAEARVREAENRVDLAEDRARTAELKAALAERRIKESKTAFVLPLTTKPLTRSISYDSLFAKKSAAKISQTEPDSLLSSQSYHRKVQ